MSNINNFIDNTYKKLILFSAFSLMRDMFSLWVYRIIIKTIKKKRLILKLSKVIEYKKITNDESIDERDEYFEKNKIILQVIKKINPKLTE